MDGPTISFAPWCWSERPIPTPRAPASSGWAERWCTVLRRWSRELPTGRRAPGRAGSPLSMPCCLARPWNAPIGSAAGRADAPRRSSGWSAGRSGRQCGRWPSASGPSRWIATCSPPTAAPAPPASPAAAWPWRTPAAGLPTARGSTNPFGQLVAAVSVGIIEGEPRLDLAYLEDRDAWVDANIVMVQPDQYVEVQGTGERGTFARGELDHRPGAGGVGHPAQLFEAQRKVARLVRLLVATRSAGKQSEIPAGARGGRARSAFPGRCRRTRGHAGGRPRGVGQLRDQRPPQGRVLPQEDRASHASRTIRGSRCSPSAASRASVPSAGPTPAASAREVDAGQQRRAAPAAPRGAGDQATGALSLRAGAGPLAGRACPRCSRGAAPGSSWSSPAAPAASATIRCS